MNEEAIATTNRMRAVTISREYGSGGGEIASRLARRLGWQLIDHSLMERVVSPPGTSQEETRAHDEQSEGVIAQFVNRMHSFYVAYTASAPPTAFLSDDVVYRVTMNKLVREATARGHVVIVGPASQVILANLPDVLHVRVIAPFEQRLAYVMQSEGLDRHTAEARIHRKEQEPATYLEQAYHHHPDEAQLYDLVLNTSRLDLESAVDILCFTLDEIAKGLAKTTGELEQAIGLPRHPAPPADFPSLAH